MHYTYPQLVGIAESGGFPPRYAGIAAAIALAESTGDPNATNHNTNGTTDYGLWQINTVHAGKVYGEPQSWFDPHTNAHVAYMLFKTQGFRPWYTYRYGTYKQFLPHGTKVSGATGNKAMVTSPVHAQAAPADTNAATAQNVGLWGDLGGLLGVPGAPGVPVKPPPDLGGGIGGIPQQLKDELMNGPGAGTGNGGLSTFFSDILGFKGLAIFTSAFWIRVGLGAAGVAIIIVAIAFMLGSSKTVRKTAEVAAL